MSTPRTATPKGSAVQSNVNGTPRPSTPTPTQKKKAPSTLGSAPLQSIPPPHSLATSALSRSESLLTIATASGLPPTVGVNWAAKAKVSDIAIASRPDHVTKPGEATLAHGSPLQLLVYAVGLVGSRTPKDEVNEVLANINKRKSGVYTSGQQGYIHVNRFIVATYESSQGSQIEHHIARIRFTPECYLRKTAIVEDMNDLRIALIEEGYECYWGCAREKDMRAVGLMYFFPDNDCMENIVETDADAWIKSTCADEGIITDGCWGQKWVTARSMGRKLQRYVKFLHPPAKHALHQIALSKSWSFRRHTVKFEPAPCIELNWPFTIASCKVSDTELVDCQSVAWGFLDKYNQTHGTNEALLDDARKVGESTFVISCSSLDLARWMCEQTPQIGTQYELAFSLNENGLYPASSRARWQNNGGNTVANDKSADQVAELQLQLQEMRKETSERAVINERMHDQHRREQREYVRRFEEQHQKSQNTIFSFMAMTQKDNAIRDEKYSRMMKLYNVEADIRRLVDQSYEADKQVVKLARRPETDLTDLEFARQDAAHYKGKLDEAKAEKQRLTEEIAALSKATTLDKLTIDPAASSIHVHPAIQQSAIGSAAVQPTQDRRQREESPHSPLPEALPGAKRARVVDTTVEEMAVNGSTDVEMTS